MPGSPGSIWDRASAAGRGVSPACRVRVEPNCGPRKRSRRGAGPIRACAGLMSGSRVWACELRKRGIGRVAGEHRQDLGRHAVPRALDVSRRASHADARSGRQGKGGGLDSSVRLAYTASLRCPLTVRLAFLDGAGTRVVRGRARTDGACPWKDASWQSPAPTLARPPSLSASGSPVLPTGSRSPRSGSLSRSPTSSRCRPTRSTGSWATTSGAPASPRSPTRAPGWTRSSERSRRSRTSPGRCRCPSPTRASRT